MMFPLVWDLQLFSKTHTNIFLQPYSMASPRLETFCCPNRDSVTDFIINFQPGFFTAICIGSAGLSMIFAFLQILPKRRGYRRVGMYPLPKPASSSRILFIITVCDILGCVGKEVLVHLTAATCFFNLGSSHKGVWLHLWHHQTFLSRHVLFLYSVFCNLCEACVSKPWESSVWATTSS